MRPFAVIRWTIAWLAIAAGTMAFADRARADTVDLLLVLAVDVSLSMDLDEQRLQRDGYVAALRDPMVLKAIASGTQGRIAVTYVEWAGPQLQATVLPWTLIDGPESAERFAATLEAKPISRARMTSISGALVYADRTIAESPFKGARRVIDVSGDGPNNAGFHVVPTRDEIVAKGIVINGLPLLLKTSQSWSAFDIPNLDAYYADCVIGGPGSFSIPVRDKSEIGTAIRKKLVLEISDLGGSETVGGLLHRTQLAPKSEPADCLIGEKLWRQYFNDLQFR
jgi:Protein of unknown function (DUF1194)